MISGAKRVGRSEVERSGLKGFRAKTPWGPTLATAMHKSMQDGIDDAACIARCLRGDASAFEPLVTRYQRVLFSVALRLVGNYEDARDATQNAFVRAYANLDRFDPAHKFFSWI